MEAAGFSYILGSIHPTIWCHNPEDNNFQNHCDENLKSHDEDVSMLISHHIMKMYG
jgi:hypothetical protein